MSDTPAKDHYAIVFQDGRKTKYTVFASTDLNALGHIFARMLKFEEMFHTFPNPNASLVLEKDDNYDPDLGAFRMDELKPVKWDFFGTFDFSRWGILIDDILFEYGDKLDSPKMKKRGKK